MNAKRTKRLNKTIDFYKRNFGFHSPYNLLVDATFCTAALEAKVNIKEQLPKYLASEVNIVTTKCIIMEAEKLSKLFNNLYGTWLIVKQFKVHQCRHKGNLKKAVVCIKSLLEKKNPHRYILATMDYDLMGYVRSNVFAAPIIFLHGQTPTIEKPPSETIEYLKEGKKGHYEMEALKEMKIKLLGEQEKRDRKRKKRNLEPNPMSCLKSKKQKVEAEPNPNSRRRKRKQKEEDILSSIKSVFSIESK